MVWESWNDFALSKNKMKISRHGDLWPCVK